MRNPAAKAGFFVCDRAIAIALEALHVRKPSTHAALDQLFLDARTHNKWQHKDVPDSLLRELVDVLKMGPTSANCSPARFVFVKSKEAKERLKPLLTEGNRDKTMQAPVCAIIGYDLEFYEHLPKLFPHTDARSWFAGKPEKIRDDRLPQRHAAGRLPDPRGARARARLRADVGLRQRRRRQGDFFAGTERQVEFPVQPRLRRSDRPQAALAALRLRRDGEDRLKSAVARANSGGETARALRIGWRP